MGLVVIDVGAGKATKPAPLPDGAISLFNRLPILQTAEVIRRARFFIGVDSGPAHLANAVQTPGIVLLGRLGKFRQYMPFTGFYAGSSPHVKIVRNLLGAVRDLTLTEVKEATHYIAMASKTYRREQNSAYDHLAPLLDADVKYRALVSESRSVRRRLVRYALSGGRKEWPNTAGSLSHLWCQTRKIAGTRFRHRVVSACLPRRCSGGGAQSACTLHPAWTLRGTPSATTQRDIPESRRAEAAGRGVLGARR